MRTTKTLTPRGALAAARYVAAAAVLVQAPGAFAGIDFIAGEPVGVAPGLEFMTAGDLDRDGRIDVVVVSPNGGQVTTFVAADTPSHFAAETPMRFGQELRDLASADLNGDGRLDVVIADRLADSIWILLGLGDGTFLPARQITVPKSIDPVAVALGNFDDVGNPDLAIADRGFGKVFILRNANGNPPCFVSSGVLDVGEEPTEIRSVDLNRDGRLDIVTLNLGAAGVDEVAVALWRRVTEGVPEFETVQHYGVGERSSGLITGDFNNDRFPDLAVLNHARGGDNNGEIRVLLNRGNGSLDPPIVVPVGCPFFTYGAPCRSLAFAPGDFDGNGTLDLVIALIDPRRTGSSASSRNDAMQVFSGSGDGTFVPSGAFATPKAPTALATGDLNGDRKVDVVVAGSELRAFVNTSAPGSKIDEPCLLPEECLSGRCVDNVCCASACDARLGERCDVPGREGICTPVPVDPRECVPGQADCPEGEFCVDGFCCDQPCEVGYCDVPGLEGVCVPGVADGEECFGRNEDCSSGHCCQNFICGREPCEGGRCEPLTGICRELIPVGAPCQQDAECASNVCDVFDGICCDRRCDTESEICRDGRCDALPSQPPEFPLAAAVGALVEPDPCDTSCPSGTVRNNGICVATPDDDGCSVAGGAYSRRTIGLLALFPLALWIGKRLRLSVVRGCNGHRVRSVVRFRDT